jgi:cell division protein FtsZ
LDEISLHGAKGVLINITGGYDLTLFELDEAANIIREKVDPDANIIVGSTLDTSMEGRLRVSVVATGIDANVTQKETPVVRRSMAAPLATSSFVAPTPEPAEAPRPALRVSSATVTQAAPAPRPAPAPVQAEPAPNLFDRQAPASYDMEEEIAVSADDLPPPAYRPQPAPQPRAMSAAIDGDASEFVAPRPRPTGTPSPEALARLQAAVSKSPNQQRPAPQAAPQPVARQAAAEAARPRFGIGSLINRMAGHGEGHAERPAAPAHTARQQPPVTSYDDEPEMSADQERIEIPAFLRRQAN